MKTKCLLLLLWLGIAPAEAVPVVPSFTQGSMTSRTEQTTKISEQILSTDYATGWQYTVTGTNVAPSGGSLTPGTSSVTQNIDGTSYTWQGLNLDQKPNWSIVTPGGGFQFSESYSGPGMSNTTHILRETEIESVTETTSVFQQ